MHQLTYIVLLTFLLGSSNGYVALWKSGDPQPLQVYPYRTEMFPEADQQALERGILIESTQELDRMLEDYLS